MICNLTRTTNSLSIKRRTSFSHGAVWLASETLLCSSLVSKPFRSSLRSTNWIKLFPGEKKKLNPFSPFLLFIQNFFLLIVSKLTLFPKARAWTEYETEKKVFQHIHWTNVIISQDSFWKHWTNDLTRMENTTGNELDFPSNSSQKFPSHRWRDRHCHGNLLFLMSYSILCFHSQLTYQVSGCSADNGSRERRSMDKISTHTKHIISLASWSSMDNRLPQWSSDSIIRRRKRSRLQRHSSWWRY